jgi:hypothetical protein
MPATYDCIATTTLGSAQSSVTFSSISGSYTDLVLIANFALSSSSQDVRLQVGNGSIDTGTNYSGTYLTGNGSSAASSKNSGSDFISGYRVTGGGTGNQTAIYQFQNYSNTTTNKTILDRINDASVEVVAGVGLWRSTSAINTIKLYPSSSNFVSGSTFTLYGIKAA